jgi:hypothetical protein
MPDSSPNVILHDAARFLALTGMGRIACLPLRGLDPRSLARLAGASAVQSAHPSRLTAPRSQAGAPIVSFLWQALGHLGLIATAGDAALLNAAALDWLDKPPAVQLDSLRHAWLAAPEICWSWLPARSRPAADRLRIL